MKRWMRSLLVTGVLIVMPAAGCSSGSSKSTDGSKTATTIAGHGPGSNDKGETFTNVKDPQGSVKGYVGAKSDATVDTCKVENGVLQVKGEVTNPTDKDQQYRIYVSAMKDGNTTVGVAQVDVPKVAGGKTTDWATILKLSEPNLTCMLRVERFAPLN